MSNGTARLTPLGILVTIIFVLGIIGLGIYLVAGDGGIKYVQNLFSGNKKDAPSDKPTDRKVDGKDENQPDGKGISKGDGKVAETSGFRKNVLERAKAAGILRVGMEPEAPPMNFANQSGQRDGFDFQVAFELAKKLGIGSVQVIEADYDELPDKLRAGDVDVLMGGYVPDASIEKVEWTDGYLDFGLCLIVKQGSAVTEPKQLSGKTVGIYKDQAARDYVQQAISGVGSVKEYQETGWFKALDNGDIDAIIYDYPFAVEEIKPFSRLRIVKLNLTESKYAIGIPAKNDDLLDALNKSIGDFTQSEPFEKLVKKYLATTATKIADVSKGAKVYVVKSGDTLSKIAEKELGDKNAWRKIYEQNRSRLANPHLIEVGFKLEMPA